MVIVEDDQLRHARQIRRERMYRKIAEHPPEGDLIARIDILVAEYQNLVLEKRTVHNAKLIRGEMLPRHTLVFVKKTVPIWAIKIRTLIKALAVLRAAATRTNMIMCVSILKSVRIQFWEAYLTH